MCPWERGRPARMDKRGPAAHCGRDARAPREPDPRSRSGSRPVGPRRSLDDHGSTSVIREPGDVESSGSCRDAVARHDNGPVMFLMGPTAAGKTRIAAELAASGQYGIVSVDSALVFRHLDIGTGKPDRELLARAPHRLIDIRNPDERYSAAEFRDDALRAIADIRASGRVPLLAGGTGLYFRALEEGLAVLPPADPAVRGEIEREASRVGWPALHSRLAGVDPSSAGRIHPNDPQRIQRALEVHELTGRPMSDLLARGRRGGLSGPVCRIVVEPADRSALHRDIETRFMRMLDAGLIDEVHALRRHWRLTERSASMRLVGYRQVWGYLAGTCSREDMTARAIAATRQLARRQLTWLRSDRTAVRVDCHAPDAAGRVAAHAGSFLARFGGASIA